MHFANNSKMINSVHNLKWHLLKNLKKTKELLK